MVAFFGAELRMLIIYTLLRISMGMENEMWDMETQPQKLLSIDCWIGDF